MTFELFTDTRSRTKEYISVTANKTFGLPRTFIDKQNITSSQRCVILYDKDTKKIALHFSDQGPKFGLAIRIPNKTQGGMVVARSFFDRIAIDLPKYIGRYDDFKKVDLSSLGYEKEGVAYVIQLKEHKNDKPVVAKDNTMVIDSTNIDLSEIPF